MSIIRIMAVSGLSIVGPEGGNGISTPFRKRNEDTNRGFGQRFVGCSLLGFRAQTVGVQNNRIHLDSPGRTIIGTRNAMNLFPMIETAISSHSRVLHNPQRSNFAWVARLCVVDIGMSKWADLFTDRVW